MGELKEKTHDPIWRPGGPVGPLNPDHMRPGWGVPSTLQTPNDWREAGRALHAGVEEQRHGVLTHRLEDVLIRNPLGHPMWRESTTPMAKKLAARLRKMPTGAIQERTVHQSAPATRADTHEAATNHRRGGLGVAGFEGVVREAIHQARCTDEQPEEPPSPRRSSRWSKASAACKASARLSSQTTSHRDSSTEAEDTPNERVRTSSTRLSGRWQSARWQTAAQISFARALVDPSAPYVAEEPRSIHDSSKSHKHASGRMPDATQQQHQDGTGSAQLPRTLDNEITLEI